MSDIKATREQISAELVNSNKVIKILYSQLESAIKYRTRMEITLELMDKDS